MNKHTLIQKIKSISELTHEEQAELISLVNNTKKYGLVWEDKFEKIEEELLTSLPVLTEVTERFIEGKHLEKKPIEENLFTQEADKSVPENEFFPNHILIEGDNLHALTALSFTHKGAIDVIYIDPPYNTGNKDFKYNDRFVDVEDTYRHSKWLSFMNKRLQIAKRLLKENGAIFVSIDDNEIAQLKLLFDEIFGEENFVSNLIWQCKKGGGNDSRYIAIEHEYILCFSKNKSETPTFFEPYSEEYLKRYKESDGEGRFFWDTFKRKSGKQYYPIKCPDGTILEYDNLGNKISWLRSEPRFLDDLKKGEIKIEARNDSWSVMFKQRLPEGKKPRSLHLDLGTTSSGSEQMLDLFSSHVFSNPKPIDLIKRLISYPSKSQIILDFFAGSGTTLHSTMQLNAEDDGSRQCILITNNENNICEDVTYERNKRVIQGYTNAKGEQIAGLTNNNLRYYKCDYIPSAKTELNRRRLTEASTDLLKIKEDCYVDITEINGFKCKQCRLFTNKKGKYMVVIYHSRNQHEVNEAVCNFISMIKDLVGKVRLYAFSPEAEVLLEDFYDVKEKVTAVPLPDAIYNAYRATFKSMGLGKRESTEEVKDESQIEVVDLFNQNTTKE